LTVNCEVANALFEPVVLFALWSSSWRLSSVSATVSVALSRRKDIETGSVWPLVAHGTFGGAHGNPWNNPTSLER
jgi:hypothetical protein